MPNLKLLFAAIAEHSVDGLLGEKARRELVGQSAIEKHDIDSAIASVNNRFKNGIDKKLAGILTNRLLDDNFVSQDDIGTFLDNPDPKRLETLIINALNTEHAANETNPDQLAGFVHHYIVGLEVIFVNNFGIELMRLGEMEGAKVAFERALTIEEQVYGTNDLNVATRISNLGHLYIKMQDFETAKSLLERALQIRQQSLPPDHPDITNTRNTLMVTAVLGQAKAIGVKSEDELGQLIRRQLNRDD